MVATYTVPIIVLLYETMMNSQILVEAPVGDDGDDPTALASLIYGIYIWYMPLIYG